MEEESVRDKFEENFALVSNFVKEHGRLPYPSDNRKLYSWLKNFKRFAHRISDEKMERFKSIGFNPNIRKRVVVKATFETNLKDCAAFIKEHGRLPYISESMRLYKWACDIIDLKKKEKLDAKKEKRLDEIGFIWQHDNYTINDFEKKFDALTDFIKEHGRLPYPSDNTGLDGWVGSIINRFNNGLLSAEKIERFNAIGFIWRRVSVPAVKPGFDKRFEELSAFVKKHGRFPFDSDEGNLAAFVHYVRGRKRLNKLSSDKVKKLESVGIIWEKKELGWYRKYEEIKNFLNNEKRLPDTFEETHNIYKWFIKYHKPAYYKKLSPQKKKFFDEIKAIGDEIKIKTELGILKAPSQQRAEEKSNGYFEKRFKQLAAFKNKRGRFPKGEDKKNYSLYLWVDTLIANKRKGKLSQERIEKLNSIDFVWKKITVRRLTWEERGRRVKKILVNENRLPSWRRDKQDNHWLRVNLKLSAKNLLDEEKKKFMDEIEPLVDEIILRNSKKKRRAARKAAWRKNFDGKKRRSKKIFNKHFRKLSRFMKRHTRMPTGKDNLKLYQWMMLIINQHNKNYHDSATIKRFERIGIIWNLAEFNWNKRADDLKTYLLAEKRFPPERQNASLAGWWCHQRLQFRRGQLSESRRKVIEEILLLADEVK